MATTRSCVNANVNMANFSTKKRMISVRQEQMKKSSINLLSSIKFLKNDSTNISISSWRPVRFRNYNGPMKIFFPTRRRVFKDYLVSLAPVPAQVILKPTRDVERRPRNRLSCRRRSLKNPPQGASPPVPFCLNWHGRLKRQICCMRVNALSCSWGPIGDPLSCRCSP